ncbi:MAG TPA: hypothetical protein VEL76_33165 [Gemmataceae bacterium]|nr:hypothetical protein [Gemmataceae bacterium]
MKKFLVMGVLALGLTAFAQQRAAAWYKWSFSAGVNLNFESANNSWLCGLFKSGQVPGYPTDGYNPWGHSAQQGMPYGGYGGDYGGYAGMYGSQLPHGAQMVAPGGGPYVPPAPQPVRPGETVPPPTAKETATSKAAYYGAYGYQPVGYYYQQPSYSQPSYYYPPQTPYYQAPQSNLYRVPSYWYGY